MSKAWVDLTDGGGNSTIIVIAHITHLSYLTQDGSKLHLSSGKDVLIRGSINDLIQKIWPET